MIKDKEIKREAVTIKWDLKYLEKYLDAYLAHDMSRKNAAESLREIAMDLMACSTEIAQLLDKKYGTKIWED